MERQFTTAVIDPAERAAFWSDLVCQHHCLVHCKTDEIGDFSAEIAVQPLGAAEISSVHSDGLLYERRTSEVRRSSEDHFLINLLLGSKALLEQGHERVVVEPGNMFLLDMERPYMVTFPERAQNIVVRIPRPLIAARLDEYRQIVGKQISGNHGLGAVVRAMLLECASQEDADDADQIAILSSLLDLFVSLLARQDDGSHPSSYDVERLGRAKRYMMGHLNDTKLSAVSVSAEVGLSTRTLYRLFAEDRTTFMQWLTDKRLEASYHALAEGLCGSVTEAALSHGFKDISHFSRTFKDRYRILPSAVRAKR